MENVRIIHISFNFYLLFRCITRFWIRSTLPFVRRARSWEMVLNLRILKLWSTIVTKLIYFWKIKSSIKGSCVRVGRNSFLCTSRLTTRRGNFFSFFIFIFIIILCIVECRSTDVLPSTN
jgi:hypothetical protein